MEPIEKKIVDDIATIISKNPDCRVIWIPEIWNDKHGHCGRALLSLFKRITIKALKQTYKFHHEIEITAQSPKAPESNYSHAREQRMIAQALGILVDENGRLQKFLENQDELDYHQYSKDGVEERGLLPLLSQKIKAKLVGKKYLLVVEHLEQPIKQDLFEDMGLRPPSKWNDCWRLTTTPSYDAFWASKSDTDLTLNFEEDRLRGSNPIKTLLLLEAYDIISSISLIKCGDYIKAANVVVECLIYCLLFSHDGGIQEDHLVKCWIEEGFISELTDTTGKITNNKEQQQDEHGEEEEKVSMFDIGKTLLEKFVTRFLLRRHSPHPDQHAVHPQIETTNIIWFAFSELYSKSFEMGIYSEPRGYMPTVEEWEKKKHISFTGSNTIKSFLPQNPKLTTLILRGCSGLKDIPDDFFQLVPCLKVLDLSYSNLTFLPSSVFCLQDLMLLSLRGCSKLRTITSSPSSSESSLPSRIHSLHSLQILDLSFVNLKSLSLNQYMPNLTDFLLVGCVSLQYPPPFLESLTNLRVFCLTGSLITTFQESTFSGMESLRILDLSDNHRLVSLPGSLSKAKLLEELSLNNCKALKDIKAIGGAKLRNFSLSRNKTLATLPESLFKAAGLHKIDLQDCQALRGINEICGAKLRILSLTNIDCLTSLPKPFSEMDSLEELYIKGCKALKEMNIAGNTNIRSFFLSGSPIVRLSLRACKSLETISLNDLEELEVLDLSFTRINELPAEIFGLPKLRQFDMLAVRQLRRFPWHAIRQLPKDFNFDQCSLHSNNTLDSREIQLPNEDKVRARIFVDDPRFFCNLKEAACEGLIGNEECLSQFHVTISPLVPVCNEISSSKKETTRSGNLPYKDIYFKAIHVKSKEDRHPNHHLCRHLTMRGIDRFPHRQFWLLNYIDSLSISDDSSVVSLSTDSSSLKFLKECQLNKCHTMEYIVVSNSYVQMAKLEILWVSGLEKLTVLFQIGDPTGFVSPNFGNLKDVHLEHCPRLDKIFPADCQLASLETLTIKVCDSLREIFYFRPDKNVNLKPRLHTIVLLETPRLLYFSEKQEVQLPALKVLQVRGCWRLRRLPLLGKVSEYSDQVVEVRGERKWWEKLIWDHYDEDGIKKTDRICFKPQSKFVSSEPIVRGKTRRKTN